MLSAASNRSCPSASLHWPAKGRVEDFTWSVVEIDVGFAKKAIVFSLQKAWRP
jgi:hypothetical protein